MVKPSLEPKESTSPSVTKTSAKTGMEQITFNFLDAIRAIALADEGPEADHTTVKNETKDAMQ